MIKVLSQMGKRHALADGENQDAVCHENSKDLCVISLADGVSTCKEARHGAIIASQAITNLFLKKGERFLKCADKQIADFALSHILTELKRKAADTSQPVEAYSSTVASVLVDKKEKRMLCFNLGDGIIIAAGKGRCKVLGMPADSTSGCCVTTTKRAENMAFVKICDIGSIDSVVICSDGAWREMFSKNKLKPEVGCMLSNNEYDALGSFLIKQNCFDDFSFVSMDMRQINRRKDA